MISYKYSKLAVYAAFTILYLGCSSNDDGNGNNSGFQNEIDTILTFGGAKNESAQSIAKTSDGGYVVLGHAQSMDGDIVDKQNESFDFWVTKFDSQSSLQWSKTYGGTSDDRGRDIIQTTDGGFAIVGSSDSSDEDVSENAGANDYWIAKLDASGNVSWQKSFGYSGSDNGFSLIQTGDNGYLVTGVLDVSASGGAGNTRNVSSRHAGGDYWAIKLDSGGVLQWSKYFGGTFTDRPYDVIQTASGYIMVGSSDSNDVDITGSKGQFDFWVISISNTGELIWEKSYGGSEIDEARGITNSGDGNFVIVGDTRSNDQDISESKGGADLWVIKINPSGELLWQKTFGGTSFDVGRSVYKTQDNGFLISGSSRSADGDLSANQGQNDAWVLKIDSDANLQWQKTVGGTDIDFVNDAVELSDGSIIAVGETSSNDGDIDSNNGFTDLLLIKLK
jgi:hypothetical protein